MAEPSGGESVITRAVRILDAFGPETTVLSLSEVSRRARLPLATTARLVKEMTRHGLLDRDEHRRVLIGTRMWELAERASPVKDLREAALQHMGDLHAVVGHSTQLGVLEGEEVLFVERLTAPGSVVNVTKIAGRLPLNASSAGLVLLAHAPDGLRERVLRGPLRSYTPHTLDREAALRAELAEVRRRGFAFCPGHIHPEATGVAVPVYRGRRVVAALGLVVPNDEEAWAFSRPLVLAGLALGRALEPNGARTGERVLRSGLR
ncbi:IclR family transcriptional regulator [Nocardiopsis terrae]|uniref:DNA-binding IclR family transcriptional regulator n=1 Tax=Nocardiopsis terrae TaxID=372655 RepID=A0ABR9HHZ7_9ACTN|nr:IclR family transcriptional regulator [Nocardiopsis terrae]MBE1458635.1 DNA-binding IclR family transcriptional regulator [Nocardiopsis terrae]GHC79347.1 IclR family transcriptional regulator [Nocardiopsis terrae]